MKALYFIIIGLYSLSIQIASLFNSKAKKWVSGRRYIFSRLKEAIPQKIKLIWVHCASLGEFEQGRPLIEKIKTEKPEYKILLTFFSPSGYEIRKNYELADYVFYLPIDTPGNAKKFINIVDPEVVVFVKYEFWFHFINRLYKQDIPVFCISAIFRKDQLFFKFYGKWYRKMLLKFTHFFVQDERSKSLLERYSINNVTISGDTRFDRVHAIVKQSKGIPLIETFTDNYPVLIAGSSWPADEKLLIEYINETPHNIKLIFAPHEIHEDHIINIEKQLSKKSIRFSNADKNNVKDNDVLIINNIGMLSSLYKYSKVAYIGGGFGKGIHNVLEAATFGQPVIFGPNHKKFKEALDLIEVGGGFCIKNYRQLSTLLDTLFKDSTMLLQSSTKSKKYVRSNLGGTQKIFESIFSK